MSKIESENKENTTITQVELKPDNMANETIAGKLNFNYIEEDPDDPLDMIPPNFEESEKHRAANYMREPIEDPKAGSTQVQENRCLCCNKAYKTRKYNICDDPKRFAGHGFGISLYYMMMRYLLYICGVLFLLCGGLMVMYVNGGISEWTIGTDIEVPEEDRVAYPNYEETFANAWSIGRIAYNDVSTALLIGGAGTIFIFYFTWVQLNTLLNSYDTRLNVDNLTPADYTVSLTGVPANEMTEQEIKDEFLRNLNGNPELLESTKRRIEVFKIIPAYHSSEYEKLRKRLSELRVKKHVIENHRTKMKEKNENLTTAELMAMYPKGYEKCNYKEICQEFSEIRRRITALTQPGQLRKLEQLFVSFTHTVANDVVDNYKTDFLRYMFGMAKYKMKNKKVYISEAPEPEDVMWENLGYTSLQRTCRVILNGFITLVMMCVCLVANIFIARASQKYGEDNEGSSVILILFNILLSLITMIINSALSFAIPKLTVYERHGSQTGYYCSVAIKLSLALFLNSGIIPLISYDEEVYFTSGGFLTTIWMNWLFVCLFGPLLEVLDPLYILSCITWKLTKKQGSNSTLTQREANIALEPYAINVVTKYSQLMNIMFYTSFYLIFFPPGILITILGIFINYWVSKCLMINRYKVPRISGEIALYCMHFMGWFFPIFTLVSIEVYIVRLKTEIMDDHLFAIIAPIVLLLVMFLLSYCLKQYGGKEFKKNCFYKLFVGDESFVTEYFDKFKDISYDPFRFMTSDYKITNPVTREEGIKELMEYCSNNAKTEEQKVVAKTLCTNLPNPSHYIVRPYAMPIMQPRPYIPQMVIAPMIMNQSMAPMNTSLVMQPQPSGIAYPSHNIRPQQVYRPNYVMPQAYPPNYAARPIYRPYIPPGY